MWWLSVEGGHDRGGAGQVRAVLGGVLGPSRAGRQVRYHLGARRAGWSRGECRPWGYGDRVATLRPRAYAQRPRSRTVTSHQTRWSGKTRVLRVPTASEPSTRCGNQRISSSGTDQSYARPGRAQPSPRPTRRQSTETDALWVRQFTSLIDQIPVNCGVPPPGPITRFWAETPLSKYPVISFVLPPDEPVRWNRANP
jgi:hypothetical protein